MKSAANRSIAFILSVLLLFSAFPLTAFGAEILYSGECGENVAWTLDSEGTLTISGDGEIDWGAWWEYKDSVFRVVIEDGVTSIGGYAFSGCTGLTSVTIGNSVTSIGDSAFYNCTGLGSITVSAGNPNYVSVNNCLIEKSSKTLILGCKNSVIPADGSVTSIGDSAFYNCTGLTNVSIPESVTSIGKSVFAECTSLRAITVDAANPNYSSDDKGVLFNKDKTVLLQYPGGGETAYSVPDGVKTIGANAFAYCYRLSSVILPQGLQRIQSYAFVNCVSLYNINIPESVTTIETNAFQGNLGLVNNYPIQTLYIDGCLIHAGNEVVAVKEGTRLIAERAIESYSGYSSSEYGLYIPKSVRVINRQDPSSLPAIYYAGSAAEWDAIQKQDLAPQTIVYNASANRVLTSGSYENISWQFTADGTLTLSGEGRMPDFTRETLSPWYVDVLPFVETQWLCKMYEVETDQPILRKIVIKDGITSVGDWAFGYVTMGDDYSSNVSGVSVEAEIVLPDSITSIGEGAFFSIGTRFFTAPPACVKIGDFAFAAVDSFGFSGYMPYLEEFTVLNPDAEIGRIGVEGFFSPLTDSKETLKTLFEWLGMLMCCAAFSEAGSDYLSIDDAEDKVEFFENSYYIMMAYGLSNVLPRRPESYYDLFHMLYEEINARLGTAFTVDDPLFIFEDSENDYSCTMTQALRQALRDALGIPLFIKLDALLCAFGLETRYSEVDENGVPSFFTEDQSVLTCLLYLTSGLDPDIPFEEALAVLEDPAVTGIFNETPESTAQFIEMVYAEINRRLGTVFPTDTPLISMDPGTGAMAISDALEQALLAAAEGTENAAYDGVAFYFLTLREMMRISAALSSDDVWISYNENVSTCLPWFTVYGYSGSTAEAYANEINAVFVDLEHMHHVPDYVYTDNGNGTHTVTDRNDPDYLAVEAHAPDAWIQTKAATCTETGSRTRRCTLCNAAQTEEIAALGHDYADHAACAATCTSGGWNAYQTCTRCDFSTYTAIPALGHSYGAWTNLNATQHQRVCARNSSHVEKAAHSWNAGQVTKAATCTEAGSKTVKCSRCAETKITEIPAAGHKAEAIPAVAATCTATGLTAGSKCAVCGTILTAQQTVAKKAHAYENKVTKATTKADGKIVPTCSVCGAKGTATTIAKASKVTISKTKFVYNGKAQKPTLTVKDSAGNVIASKYYTVKWSNSKSKAVGKYTVKITFKGNYSGTKTLTYTIVPKQVTGVKNASSATKSIKLSWTKATGAKYYEVYGSTDGKTFKKITTVSTNSAKITKVNGKALSAGKTYYFKVRALDPTKKLIGAFSKVLKTGTQTKAPVISKLTSAKSGTATVTWGKVTGAKSYTVYTSTNGKTFKAIKSGITKTSFTLTDLTPGKRIYIKVVAVNAYGKAGAFSTAKSVTVKK